MKQSFNTTKQLPGLLIDRRYRLLGHLIFIAVYLTYIIYCAAFYRPFIPDSRIHIAVWSWFLVSNISLAYLNIYFLMPRYLYHQRYTTYTICLAGFIILMILSSVIVTYILDMLYQSGQFLSTLLSLRVLIPLLFACPMTVVLYRHWYTHGMRISQLENISMQSELEQLKKQINPHFLFNMLNNIIVLSKTNPREAAEVQVKLKDLLNYQLIDSTRDEVLLKDDIHFLNDYLNLEKVRRDSFDFTVVVEGETNGVRIPPLLFIPFVENAVKHNPESDDYLPYVHIRFRLFDGILHFSCTNSIPAVIPEKDVYSGLGLANARRRLSLLYPQRHSLDIKSGNGQFQIDLQIPYSPKELST